MRLVVVHAKLCPQVIDNVKSELGVKARILKIDVDKTRPLLLSFKFEVCQHLFSLKMERSYGGKVESLINQNLFPKFKRLLPKASITLLIYFPILHLLH